MRLVAALCAVAVVVGAAGVEAQQRGNAGALTELRNEPGPYDGLPSRLIDADEAAVAQLRETGRLADLEARAEAAQVQAERTAERLWPGRLLEHDGDPCDGPAVERWYRRVFLPWHRRAERLLYAMARDFARIARTLLAASIMRANIRVGQTLLTLVEELEAFPDFCRCEPYDCHGFPLRDSWIWEAREHFEMCTTIATELRLFGPSSQACFDGLTRAAPREYPEPAELLGPGSLASEDLAPRALAQ